MSLIFFQSLLIAYSGAIMPGTLLTYTLDMSLKKGIKAGVLIPLGHAILEAFVVILLFLGLGKYITTPMSKMIIGIIGGAVMVYLGITMIKDILQKRLSFNVKSNDSSYKRNLEMVIGGFVISAVNPYFTIWWAIIGLSLMTSAYSLHGFVGVSLFYTGHIIADISWYLLIAILISKTKRFINLKAYSVIIGVLGLVMICFGINFFVQSIKTII
ncbi:LysE family transporter [Acetivibrio cellulolyticus]|uniref:LysE family transporter n=1 Tax=Acetivibrio cellulolyticus TaxID=35830 RepID=UPI0001E2C1CF|nr:LysE family transporter [Acetivibrio cellulolyticus]